MSSSADTASDICAACGKEGDSLKACTACKMVKYCNRECQISHRKQHKKECKKRAAELYDEKLFKEIEQEECPICLLPLEKGNYTETFKSCCAKLICNGCIVAMKMSEGKDLCAFCRTPPPSSNEEEIERTKKLMESGNAGAFNQLAGYYDQGMRGLPQDCQKAHELFLKAGELGCAWAYYYYNLGVNYDEGRGVEVDRKKAKHYWELAAMGGDISARHNIGVVEGRAGNFERAYKHYMIAARAGQKRSLDYVKRGFMDGHVTKDEYTITLRAYQKSQDEMKSDERDKAKEMGWGEWIGEK